MSYLINAGAGREKDTLELRLDGPIGTFAEMKTSEHADRAMVPVVRADSIVDEDVFLFKIDTQGFDHYVLEGAKNLFEKHTVRQVIFGT